MICNAKPYEGTDAFLFVSYARKDAGIVYPLIERLASAGVRLWYDAGLQGGEIWPEVIADHLNRSAACLAFVSRNAVASHNCFHELIFAVESGKPLIPIRYQEAQLSLGMKMMIGAVQWLEIGKIPTDADISRILSLDLIKPVHGLPDCSIVIQDYNSDEAMPKEKPLKWKPEFIDPMPEEKKMSPEPSEQPDVKPVSAEQPDSQNISLQRQDEMKHPDMDACQEKSTETAAPVQESDEEIRRQQKSTEPKKDTDLNEISSQEHIETHTINTEYGASKPDSPRRRTRRRSQTEAEENKDPEVDPHGKTYTEDIILEKTVAEDKTGEETVAGDEDEFDKTIAAPVEIPPVFVILTGGGIRYLGKVGTNVLGRSKTKADIVIPDPERKVSGEHVRVSSLEGIHLIEDMHSTNGTWVDGILLPAEEKRKVENFCELQLFRTNVIVAFDKTAESLQRANMLLVLRCDETGETKYLWQGELTLGRNSPWKEDVLSDKKVSHKHASFRITGNRCTVQDDNSTNGTLLNGDKMERGEEKELLTGDIIQIGIWHFIATVIDLNGGKEE